MSGELTVRFQFEAVVIHWRGPSPYFFAPIPEQHGEEIKKVAKFATYGWGVIPVEATIDDFMFGTSLFPKDGSYLLPLKDDVRRKCNLTAGDSISVSITIRLRGR
ncbi:DUF1905 domain-containing protein [Mesorhizobium sp. WSM4307]|uniref:DUF1905 domain-containing protein n=1 Tax=unclassified Mesorhizobium TaxID=325217 RepID=UPI00115C80DB|nr:MULTISPECIES: DUF1905 domain-containing protein [unclassified Mesorhizobium]TRC81087.1 DUF1905 domain-containing protein [Mesorhizobium sp. WSM4315]TRC87325.1 DUF1905 domain-containing protein [Mesorhizobium sp. WSM4307]